jgi:hypothetical protein
MFYRSLKASARFLYRDVLVGPRHFVHITRAYSSVCSFVWITGAARVGLAVLAKRIPRRQRRNDIGYPERNDGMDGDIYGEGDLRGVDVFHI